MLLPCEEVPELFAEALFPVEAVPELFADVLLSEAESVPARVPLPLETLSAGLLFKGEPDVEPSELFTSVAGSPTTVEFATLSAFVFDPAVISTFDEVFALSPEVTFSLKETLVPSPAATS